MKYASITVLVLLAIGLSLVMLQSVQSDAQKERSSTNLGKTILTPTTNAVYSHGPVAWYKMDEISWNGRTNEVVNSVPSRVSGVASGQTTTTALGKYNRSSNLDGVNDYIDLGDHFDFNYTDDWTFCAWINPTSVAASQAIISKNNWNSPYDGWQFAIRAGGYLQFDYIVSWSANAVSYQTTAAILTAGSWQHVCVVYNNKAMTFYKDGVSYPTTLIANTVTSSINNAKNTSIGARDNGSGSFFAGKIDDVRIYDYARTQPQILVDMAGTSTLLDETGLGRPQVTTQIVPPMQSPYPTMYPTTGYPTPMTMGTNGIKFHSLLIPAYEKSLVYRSEPDDLSMSIQYAPPPTGQPDYVTQDKLWFRATKVALGTTPSQVAEMRVMSDQKISCPEPNPNNPFCKPINLEDLERLKNGLKKYDSGDIHGLIHTTGYEYAYLTVVFVDRTNAYEISSSVGQGAEIMSGQRQRLDEYLSKIKMVDE